MSEQSKPIRNMKVIVGIIALAWATVMIAFYLGMEDQGDWMEDTAAFWAFLCGLGALLGAVFTYLKMKLGVLIYVVANVALIMAPFMQSSMELPFTMNWGFLVLGLVYLVAVIPAWPHMGKGSDA
jgi:peptidoglycan/LPS O-acetylase OafA/YrhL